MLWSSRLQFYPPDSEQLAASLGEIAREVDVFLWAPPPACLHAGWRRVDSIRNNRATSRAVFARLSPAFTVGNRLRIHGICDEGRNITGTTRFRNLGSVNA